MATQISPPAVATEIAESKALALRYRTPYVDLTESTVDLELLRLVPVDMMFRYNFVPVAIEKSRAGERVLEEVTEGFTLDVVSDQENPDETLSIDKISAGGDEIAPVIKLVDTTIFNALERRASDIHIETRDQEVVIKYRIDGVLHYAMSPIAKDWSAMIISRIKVMSELDISERRVPQDGRFRVRYKGRLIDFRVSVMPTVHGEDSVLRVLDKESMSEKFSKLSLEVVGFSDSDLRKFRLYIKEPYGMVLVTGPTGSG